MTLVLVRHGETSANAQRLLVGRMDPPLTERGEGQARALAASVGGVNELIVSPLRRTRQTAAAFGVPVRVDERWIEVDYGELDGCPVSEAWSPLWERWQADAEFTPSGGESLADVGRRVRAACEELREEAAAGDVVVVTHVGPIKAAVTWALGAADEVAWRMFVDVASVTRIDIGGRGPVLRSFNEVHHLPVP